MSGSPNSTRLRRPCTSSQGSKTSKLSSPAPTELATRISSQIMLSEVVPHVKGGMPMLRRRQIRPWPCTCPRDRTHPRRTSILARIWPRPFRISGPHSTLAANGWVCPQRYDSIDERAVCTGWVDYHKRHWLLQKLSCSPTHRVNV